MNSYTVQGILWDKYVKNPQSPANDSGYTSGITTCLVCSQCEIDPHLELCLIKNICRYL